MVYFEWTSCLYGKVLEFHWEKTFWN